MSEPNTRPLAALLASHPEECAAVLCALMVAGVTKDGRTLANVAALCRMRLDPDDAQRILDAMVAAGIVYRTCLPGAVWVLVIKGAEPERAAIARMGAAAWLAGRCPRVDSHRFFDLSNARLHEIAAGAMRSAVSEEDRKAAYRVRAQCDSAVPQSAETYRYVLTSIVARGTSLDVEAEVAAVWGAQP